MPIEGRILIIGSQPPPLHGMSMVNGRMTLELKEARFDVVVLNTAADSLSVSFSSRVSRIGKVGRGIFYLLRHRHFFDAIYISVSGGLGQIYEAIFASLAARSGARLFLHHHSFAYLDSQLLISKILFRLSGYETTHIVLCNRMSSLLKSRYKSVRKTHVQSNAVFCGEPVYRSVRQKRTLTLGYLSNISVEKGIFLYLDTLNRLDELGVPVAGIIAGPFSDATTENRVLDAVSNMSSVDYIGRVDSEKKKQFFLDIDLLLFPSMYKNEASPLIIFEAMQHGVPFIASDRGCLKDFDAKNCGLVIPAGSNFVDDAVVQISLWSTSGDSIEGLSFGASKRYVELRDKAKRDLKRLFNLMKPKVESGT